MNELSQRRGAYGLVVVGTQRPESLCVAPDTWTEWSFSWSDARREGPLAWSDSRAELRVAPEGRVLVDRDRQLSTFCAVRDRGPEALLHPLLGTTAVCCAAWRGDMALHAGVIVVAGRAWGILGERGAGKSSILGWALRNDHAVVADDLLVTDGANVLAGPRIVDLRFGAAEHFGLGVDIGVVGTRRRWRVAAGPVSPSTPLGGWVELCWGSQLRVDTVPLADRLAVLARHRALQLPIDNDARTGMQVLTLPALRFTRPQRWHDLDHGMATLVDQLAAVASAT